MSQNRLDTANFCSFAARVLISGYPDLTDNDDNTIMHECAAQADPTWVRLFLDMGTPADRPNRPKFANTPLHIAALSNVGDSHYDVMALLIPNYEDINIKNALGKTPLHLVLMKSNIKVVQLFLDSGANTIELDSAGRCALVLGALKGDVEVLRALLDKTQEQWPAEVIRNRHEIMQAAELKQNRDCINLLTEKLF